LSGETVKLSDFGLSNTLSSSQASHRRAGTPAYAAPEIMAGQRTRWSDQFALAVTYCELRGGRRPFDSGPGRYGNEYVYPEPDLSMLPTDERGAVARALSFNPWERWKSCGEFMSQLNRIAGKKTA